ncbi:MAG: hypothetical protein AAGJ73_03840 [Pseudomonadota bacterium]
MNMRFKSLAILIATLMIGVVAGATVTGALLRERLEYIRSFSKAEGFVVRFGELVEPLTPQQRTQVEPLLKNAGAEIEAIFSGSGEKVYAIIEQLEKDLAPHLNEEQLLQLQQRRLELRNRYIGRFTIATEEDLNDGE